MSMICHALPFSQCNEKTCRFNGVINGILLHFLASHMGFEKTDKRVFIRFLTLSPPHIYMGGVRNKKQVRCRNEKRSYHYKQDAKQPT